MFFNRCEIIAYLLKHAKKAIDKQAIRAFWVIYRLVSASELVCGKEVEAALASQGDGNRRRPQTNAI